MSILIKGMKMPKNCDECPCYYETEGAWRNECEVLGREYTASENRPKWCPLVELPAQHGRLIDADALMEEFLETYTEYERKKLLVFYAAEVKQEVADMITDAPTIIPAEEGE